MVESISAADYSFCTCSDRVPEKYLFSVTVSKFCLENWISLWHEATWCTSCPAAAGHCRGGLMWKYLNIISKSQNQGSDVLAYLREVLLQVPSVTKMLVSFCSKQIWKFETVNIILNQRNAISGHEGFSTQLLCLPYPLRHSPHSQAAFSLSTIYFYTWEQEHPPSPAILLLRDIMTILVSLFITKPSISLRNKQNLILDNSTMLSGFLLSVLEDLWQYQAHQQHAGSERAEAMVPWWTCLSQSNLTDDFRSITKLHIYIMAFT